ncbi:hypothetical protein HY478_02295 [Candidatus Uhrbacteria bacterium]|nr:hypothetical protein [Candidatus Uhrbacteria bacterium]
MHWRADSEIREGLEEYFEPKQELPGYWPWLEHLRVGVAALGAPYLDPAVRSYPLKEVAHRDFAALVVEAWRVNCFAKSQSEDWYVAKDVLLRIIASRAGDALPEVCLGWGVGEDEQGDGVLYVDLAGYGQVSFHLVQWESGFSGALPRYEWGWTGIPNDTFEFSPVAPVDVRINARANGVERGELHNQFIRAGLDPAPVWQGLGGCLTKTLLQSGSACRSRHGGSVGERSFKSSGCMSVQSSLQARLPKGGEDARRKFRFVPGVRHRVQARRREGSQTLGLRSP